MGGGGTLGALLAVCWRKGRTCLVGVGLHNVKVGSPRKCYM